MPLTFEGQLYSPRSLQGHLWKSSDRYKFLVYKVLGQGYYWPTMHRDATDLVQRCD